ncbi:MAG: hypothetical protein ACREQQ_08880, partial [Candidatus Binatia bacterium]
AAEEAGEKQAEASFDVDLANLATSPLATTGVLPGDSLTVRPIWVVTVEGWVARPGTYTLVEQPTLPAVLAAAGGTLFASRRGGIEIVRSDEANGDGEAAIAADGQEIRDGDVLRVPSSGALVVPWAVTRIFTWPFD